jgi:hypothetical protein
VAKPLGLKYLDLGFNKMVRIYEFCVKCERVFLSIDPDYMYYVCTFYILISSYYKLVTN